MVNLKNVIKLLSFNAWQLWINHAAQQSGAVCRDVTIVLWKCIYQWPLCIWHLGRKRIC